MCSESVHDYYAHVTAKPTAMRVGPEAIKILAHPLRSRLLSALRQSGPASATTLAGALGTNSGATSYHLRKLAAVALVVDTEAGIGKERLWAAAAEESHLDASDMANDEDAETALGWLTRDWLRHFAEKYGAWLDVESSWPTPWRDAAGMNDAGVLVTAEQLRALHAEITDVIHRYRMVGQGNPEAKRVSINHTSYPIDLTKRPRGTGERSR